MFPSPFARLFRHKISLLCNGKPYRKQQRKATGKRNSYQKVIICLAVTSTPNLCLLRRNFCAAGGRVFSYSGAILERLRTPFIDYCGAKYVRSALKIAAAQKALFLVVENCDFLKRLRNVHLEKSAVTGV